MDEIEAMTRISRAVAMYEQDHCVGPGEYTYMIGSLTSYVALREEPDVAIKIPISEYTQRSEVSFEKGLLSLLGGADSSPLRAPTAFDANTDFDPCFLVMQRQPGHSLSLSEIRALSDEDQKDFGTKVGRFVAWIADRVPLTDYYEVLKSSKNQVYDRQLDIANLISPAQQVFYERVGCAGIWRALNDNWQYYLDEVRDGFGRPTQVGHDDLHQQNVLFVPQDDGFRTESVIDFGHTKPSTPERELRHIWAMGGVAAQSAVAAYESETGAVVDEKALDHWAFTQALATYAQMAHYPDFWQGGINADLSEEMLYRLRRFGTQYDALATVVTSPPPEAFPEPPVLNNWRSYRDY